MASPRKRIHKHHKLNILNSNSNVSAPSKQRTATSHQDGNGSTLQEWKLRIYNGDRKAVRRYYYSDYWCHEYCLFSSCKNRKKCKGKHCYKLDKFLSNGKIDEARTFGEYLLYFYTYHGYKQKIDKKRAWIAHVIWKLAKIYSKNSVTGDCQLAVAYFEQAIQLHEKKETVMIDYANFLHIQLGQLHEAERYLRMAVSSHDDGYTNFEMAKFLSNEKRYVESQEYLDKVYLLTEDIEDMSCLSNCTFFYQYGFVLYKLKQYSKSYQMYNRAIKIDETLSNSSNNNNMNNMNNNNNNNNNTTNSMTNNNNSGKVLKYASDDTFEIMKDIEMKLNEQKMNETVIDGNNGADNSSSSNSSNSNSGNKREETEETKDNNQETSKIKHKNKNRIKDKNKTKNKNKNSIKNRKKNRNNNNSNTSVRDSIKTVSNPLIINSTPMKANSADFLFGLTKEEEMMITQDISALLGTEGGMWKCCGGTSGSTGPMNSGTSGSSGEYGPCLPMNGTNSNNNNNNNNNNNHHNDNNNSSSMANKTKVTTLANVRQRRKKHKNGNRNKSLSSRRNGKHSSHKNRLKDWKCSAHTSIDKESTRMATSNDNDGSDSNSNSNSNSYHNYTQKFCNNRNPLVAEFDRFWNTLPILQSSCKRYYKKFAQNDYNSIGILPVIDENTLLQDIGMNKLHCKQFLHHLSIWKENHNQFVNWIKKLELFEEYFECFISNGIYTLESFYYNFASLNQLIDVCHNHLPGKQIAVIKFDCQHMWKNTPQYQRLSKLPPNHDPCQHLE